MRHAPGLFPHGRHRVPARPPAKQVAAALVRSSTVAQTNALMALRQSRSRLLEARHEIRRAAATSHSRCPSRCKRPAALEPRWVVFPPSPDDRDLGLRKGINFSSLTARTSLYWQRVGEVDVVGWRTTVIFVARSASRAGPGVAAPLARTRNRR